MALAKEKAEQDEEEEVSEESVQGIYLLTDGKPDTSMSKVSSSSPPLVSYLSKSQFSRCTLIESHTWRKDSLGEVNSFRAWMQHVALHIRIGRKGKILDGNVPEILLSGYFVLRISSSFPMRRFCRKHVV